MLWLSGFTSSAKALCTAPSLFFFFVPPNPRIPSPSSSSFSFSSGYSRFPIAVRTVSSFASAGNEDALAGVCSNYAGVTLEETVPVESGKVRLDSWISSRVSGISRARVQSSIRLGLVRVNGQVVDKVTSFFL